MNIMDIHALHVHKYYAHCVYLDFFNTGKYKYNIKNHIKKKTEVLYTKVNIDAKEENHLNLFLSSTIYKSQKLFKIIINLKYVPIYFRSLCSVQNLF